MAGAWHTQAPLQTGPDTSSPVFGTMQWLRVQRFGTFVQWVGICPHGTTIYEVLVHRNENKWNHKIASIHFADVPVDDSPAF
jgi:hypothetical protein